jgi:hypothetical protein
MAKPILWLLIAALDKTDLAYVIPTVAWMANDAGAEFETYFESEREGKLFAETGSTVIGGHHHQQFNYLCAAFDIKVLKFGESSVFTSSIETFRLQIIAKEDRAADLYAVLLEMQGVGSPDAITVGPSSTYAVPDSSSASPPTVLAPYLYPDIFFGRTLGCSETEFDDICNMQPNIKINAEFLDSGQNSPLSDSENFDVVKPDDDIGSITMRIARRWQTLAKGLVFADPPAVLSQLASHCRHHRVAVFQPVRPADALDVNVSAYAEATSPIAGAAADLAVAIGNRSITGRQTGDGDIFEWSKRGVSIQIIDPNRPAFPVVQCVKHRWAEAPIEANAEVSDEQLNAWADEGRVLTTLMFHSGEVAHNEAMLAMIEMAGWSGLKMGLGVHASRYESCPQMWELLNIPMSRGGALGLVEPVLHSGGLGVMVEALCPPELLRENCIEALARIESIAGPAATPRGYYAFMDSNLDRLDHVRGDVFTAIADAGLDYVVSSALPGRNRILWRSPLGGSLAFNQTPRIVEGTSPFVRATSPHDVRNTWGAPGPGWMIATFDAPVIAFAPYIWREGNRFMAVVERMSEHGRINVLPRTIARYAALLATRGILPTPVAAGDETIRFAL